MSQARAAIQTHAPTLATIVLMIAAAGYAFSDSAVAMSKAWNSEEYSHGWLLPVLAAMLAHNRLTETRPEVRPSWIGVGIVVAAVALQIVGVLSALPFVTQYALLLAIVGILVTLIGPRTVLVIAAPLVILVFAVPLPFFLYQTLSTKLQLISTDIGVAVLSAFGMSVFQQGNIIDLGVYQIQVVEACSGLRYLFPLMSLSYLVAYLMEDAWWKRIVLFVSAAPLAIVMNSLRIAAIGFTVDIWGTAAAEGLLHDFEGWSVFLACVVVLMAEAWLLLKIPPRGRLRMERFALGRGRAFANTPRLGAPTVVSLAALCVAATLVGSGYLIERPERIPYRESLASFPSHIGSWRGSRQALDTETLNFLKPTDYLLADYYPENQNEKPINLYVIYHASQRTGGAHSPQSCIPADGWRITDLRRETLVTVRRPNGMPLPVNRVIIERGESRQLVYYWFVQRDRYLTSEYAVKWYLFWDSLTRRRTDGALVRVVVPFPYGADLASTEKRTSEFLAKVANELDIYLGAR